MRNDPRCQQQGIRHWANFQFPVAGFYEMSTWAFVNAAWHSRRLQLSARTSRCFPSRKEPRCACCCSACLPLRPWPSCLPRPRRCAPKPSAASASVRARLRALRPSRASAPAAASAWRWAPAWATRPPWRAALPGRRRRPRWRGRRWRIPSSPSAGWPCTPWSCPPSSSWGPSAPCSSSSAERLEFLTQGKRARQAGVNKNGPPMLDLLQSPMSFVSSLPL